MCKASKVSADINFSKLPLIKGVFDLAQKGFIPGGSKRNLDFVSPDVNFSANIAQEEKYLMADAQTSGGLLISVPRDKVETLQDCLQENNCLASSMVGEIYNPDEVSIYVN
jgi:selenide,water dikinase